MKWVLGSFLAVSLLAGCGKSAPEKVALPLVETLRVQPGAVALRESFVGRVAAYKSANVVARVSGVLQQRLYREGGQVRQGQALFQIDPAYYRAQWDDDLALLAEDRATLANAIVTARRDRALLAIGSVSRQTVDDAQAAQRSAEAKVQADQAQVATARLNLGYTRVVSPIDGIAGQQQATVGALVGNGTTDSGAGGTLLTTVQDLDRVYVRFTISAADLLELRRAQASGSVRLAGQRHTRVAIILPDGSSYGHPGTLDFAGAQVDPSTGTVDMRAVFSNPRHLLLPGMYVNVDVDLGTREGVFLVPQQALQRDSTGAYLLVVGPHGTERRVDVSAKASQGNDWIVTRGLASGEQVIVSGLQVARPGDRVQASAWAPARPASAPAGASSSAPGSAH